MVATMTTEKVVSRSDVPDFDIDEALKGLKCGCCGKRALDCTTFFPNQELCGDCNPSTSHMDLDSVVLLGQGERANDE
jgi:uncharacterized OB-fold protein